MTIRRYFESISKGKGKFREIVKQRLIYPSLKEKYGYEIANEIIMIDDIIDKLFRNKANWMNLEEFRQSLETPNPRPYNEIFPIVQQSHIGSCWINAILVALIYPYHLKAAIFDIIKFLSNVRNQELEQVESHEDIIEIGFARIIQIKLQELFILQYGEHSTMKEKLCIKPELSFVRDFITLLTQISPNIFKTFSKYDRYEEAIMSDQMSLADVILEEGGTILDILKLIGILLEYGLKFTPTFTPTQVKENNFIQNYTKELQGKIITIRVAPKLKDTNYQNEVYIPSGFRFASIILVNINEKKNEEQHEGHVITIVTDQNNKLFFYNGWMNDRCITPLQPTNGANIKLETEDEKELVFDLTRSFGIIFSFKVEPIPI